MYSFGLRETVLGVFYRWHLEKLNLKKKSDPYLRDNDKSTALNMFKLFSQFSPQVIRTKSLKRLNKNWINSVRKCMQISLRDFYACEVFSLTWTAAILVTTGITNLLAYRYDWKLLKEFWCSFVLLVQRDQIGSRYRRLLFWPVKLLYNNFSKVQRIYACEIIVTVKFLFRNLHRSFNPAMMTM